MENEQKLGSLLESNEGNGDYSEKKQIMLLRFQVKMRKINIWMQKLFVGRFLDCAQGERKEEVEVVSA